MAPKNKDLLAVKGDPPRDRHGRYLIMPPGADKTIGYTRATTVAKVLDDTHNLDKWNLRTLAQGLAHRGDLIAMVATHNDDKKKLDELCVEALAAGLATTGSNIGTALHAATDTYDRTGKKPKLPAPYDADLDAYIAACEASKIEMIPHYIERIVVNDKLQIAGTFDRIVRLPTGEMIIADLKTGQDLSWSWGAIAIQLAIYANADNIYDPHTHFRTELPADLARTQGLIIHLPSGQARCDLYLVDLIEGHIALSLATEARAYRKKKGLSRPYIPSTIVAPDETRNGIIKRIEALRAHDAEALPQLAALWPPNIKTFKQSTGHTYDDLAAIAAVVSLIEANFGIPF